ncbi:MAG: dipeptide/oligopeptide/nickel ABC transporter permease/ATP-binding protein [Rhodobacteraceae bacterium]|nr:dipeptide/oligopeptide/nickel ABC transporter permease/ATP-binding protein [Paracoccaceae bacterium]
MAEVTPGAANGAAAEAAGVAALPPRRTRLDDLRRLVRQPKGVIGLALVAFYAVLAVAGPSLAPLDPYVQNFAATLRPPSSAHWFGTDQLGRDVFSRVLTGARASLGIGVGGVAVAFVVGVPLGLAAAWRRGWLDMLVMRAVDIMLSFPDIVFALAIVAVLGASTENVIIAVGVVAIPVFVRTSRAVAMSVIAEPFVEGNTALGSAPLRVLALHVLPNMAGILVTLASLLFASTLLAASGLGFLGLGVQPPQPEWGTMLGESRSYIRSHPFLATFPGLFLAVSALGFNLLGEALRTIYDPTAVRIPRRFRRRARPAAAARGGDREGAAAEAVVAARDLEVSYLTERGHLPAVRGVDIDMVAGRTLAIVGESGSGKSTLLRAIGTLLPAGQAAVTGGRLVIAGSDPLAMSPAAIRALRRRAIGVVFQDAASALNPVMTIGDQLVEAITAGRPLPRREARRIAAGLLRDVQISDPEGRLDTYPHQFSGGMKQRMVIAIALAQAPAVLLADEPTSALDVTIQQQILTLLRDIQRRRGMAMLLVTHDLGLVARYADDVGVMYAGRIVEAGAVEQVFGDPRHPYTRALRLSTPRLRSEGAGRLLPAIAGEPPLIGHLPPGCAFAPRCPLGAGRERCRTAMPELRPLGCRAVACHFAEEVA